ncbi:hypothetical protein Nepgr_015715 [Nepenthes gracilis]|uniref:Thaumatin-like protein n=1 Tax=Nepenthes gracilis TaxID=150966 RepID=A0AAD3XRC7_NEPGR|nr:hypothetical protein Nepgr_015715 [Nepenthes gracilis]
MQPYPFDINLHDHLLSERPGHIPMPTALVRDGYAGLCLAVSGTRSSSRVVLHSETVIVPLERTSAIFHDGSWTPAKFLTLPPMNITGRTTSSGGVSATVFSVLNRCSYPVWPGTLSSSGPTLGDGGFALPPGATIQLTAPQGWSGRFWARTGCTFDESGVGNCTTGDCGGLHCTGGGVPPVSLAEFTIDGSGGQDFYDVSLVDGYNVGVGVRPSGGTGKCQYAGCVTDLNASCPPELRVTDPRQGGSVVACKSACAAFKAPEFCCTGDHASPQTCSPSQYSEMFKNACPTAYSYAYDDASSTCTCTGSDYLITFCPTAADI